MLNLAQLCQSVCHIVLQTADYIRSEVGNVAAHQIDTKQRNHLVSYVDRTAEQRLIAALTPLLPNAGFIAEESFESLQTHEYYWVIDPLDGTTNFLHQIPAYGISVALLHQSGQVVLGVVCEVCRNELFSAYHQGGAYLNGQAIQVAQQAHLADGLFATGFPYYDYTIIQAYLSVLQQLMLQTKGVRRMGAAAIDLCYVACGRFDGFFEHSLFIWDVAAASLIVTEAGGRVADFGGGEQYLWGRQIMAASAAVWQPFGNLVQQYLGQLAPHREAWQ